VLPSGWPDFLVTSPDGTNVFAIEVKHDGDQLSDAQIKMHQALERCGIRVLTVRTYGAAGWADYIARGMTMSEVFEEWRRQRPADLTSAG
jgi:hypothetical protein